MWSVMLVELRPIYQYSVDIFSVFGAWGIFDSVKKLNTKARDVIVVDLVPLRQQSPNGI